MKKTAASLFCFYTMLFVPASMVMAEDSGIEVGTTSEYWVSSSSAVHGYLKIEETSSAEATNITEEERTVVDMNLSFAGTTTEQGFNLRVWEAGPSQFSVSGQGYLGVAIGKLGGRGAVWIDVKRNDKTIYSAFYIRNSGLSPCTLLTPWFNVDNKTTVKVGLSHSEMGVFKRKYYHP